MRNPGEQRAAMPRHGRMPGGIAVAIVFLSAAAMADPPDLTPPPAALNPTSPPTAAPPASKPAAPTAGFIFPDSDQRRLTDRDVAGLSCDRLAVARNEIFARHGRYFQRADLTRYFSQFGWYKPTTWSVTLSPVEQENVRLLAEAQRHC